MNEFFNWNDTWIVAQHNWVWLLVAGALGIWTGWRTSSPTSDDSK